MKVATKMELLFCFYVIVAGVLLTLGLLWFHDILRKRDNAVLILS
jgi:hypothetical protein